ncbi:beta-etherase [Novosphingobium arvoryzae]|uniref:Beta-aryl ether-cleaving enzyme n=1 Tax=Novosphingobium arvoryzae TaxID=1256514 RepID=A0A918RM73_9SPHN|nr:beta-etherase [Novosphingobium arvoryzae]GHA02713.1 beta-aryl ether-cleaving enzyme [Novosphingobium arvoryzae]
MPNPIKFFDLALSHGATISPFVWATKYAIAHKGLEMEVVPGGFTGIMERTGGKSERLPAIVDDGEWVLDSWLIAEHLDAKYPDRPTLIGDPSVKVLTQFIETWLWQTAISPWMTCYIKNYRDWSVPEDHAYVTESRERMFGRKIEDIIVGREDRLPQVPPKLELLRGILKEHKWLGGESPNYADYRALAVFLFCASVADTPPLTADDPLRDWIDRGFDLYGGLGRHPGLKPLFGLELREGDPEPFAKGPTMVSGLVSRNTGPQSTAAETARLKRQS